MHDRASARRPSVAGAWPLGLGLAASIGTSTALAGPALASAAPAERSAEPAPTDAEDDAAAEPAPIYEDATEDDATENDAAENDATLPAPNDAEAPRPPRIDGTYVGGILFSGIGLTRVNDLETNGAFAAFGAAAGVGQMVFPWLGLGLHGGGGGGTRSEQGARQKLGQGYLGAQFKFVPLSKRQVPLSLLASFGFGGGAVRQAGIDKRSGFGGAQFSAAVRYELFPWAQKRRPFRAGGFGLGPEIGWIGFTPAAAGRPMSNVLYLAIATTFYFGS